MSAAIATNRLRSQLKVAGIAHLQSSGSVATTSPNAPEQEIVKSSANQRVNDDLVRAIDDKRLVEFVYKTGRTRIVEPHDYGIRRGAELLLGFQIGGESQSGARHGWRLFDVHQIRHLRVLERRFAGTRADSAQHHRMWDTLFARVT